MEAATELTYIPIPEQEPDRQLTMAAEDGDFVAQGQQLEIALGSA